MYSRYRVNDDLEIALGVNNLSDEDFNTVALSTSMPGGVPNRGREVIFNVKWLL